MDWFALGERDGEGPAMVLTGKFLVEGDTVDHQDDEYTEGDSK